MPKTLFLIESFMVGGAETYLLRFLEYCRPEEAFVLSKSGKGGALEERFRGCATVVRDIRLNLYNPLTYARLYRYLRANRFDAVCDMQGNFAGWTLLCARLAGVRCRLAFYRQSQNQFKPDPIRQLYTRLITWTMQRCATRILSNSKAALDHFHPDHEAYPNRFRVIYNGFDASMLSTADRLDVRRTLGIAPEAFVVAHSGRLAAAKNHETILACAKQLCTRHSDIHFVLMGRAVDTAYRKTIADLGLEKQIHLLGYRSDVLDLLRGADLFYFPSLNEGQPNALIEAMASGLPFVASDIPPIRECVPETCFANLLSPTDVEAHVARIEQFYHHRDELKYFTCQDWAIDHFDARRLFNAFREEIETPHSI